MVCQGLIGEGHIPSPPFTPNQLAQVNYPTQVMYYHTIPRQPPPPPPLIYVVQPPPVAPLYLRSHSSISNIAADSSSTQTTTTPAAAATEVSFPELASVERQPSRTLTGFPNPYKPPMSLSNNVAWPVLALAGDEKQRAAAQKMAHLADEIRTFSKPITCFFYSHIFFNDWFHL
jgi:hypothetical protein